MFVYGRIGWSTWTLLKHACLVFPTNIKYVKDTFVILLLLFDKKNIRSIKVNPQRDSTFVAQF